ncbi:MAG TPA: hypothetical protein VI585_02295 [Candidatus Binatia bacterium]
MRAVLVLALMLTLLSSGCGKKADPRAPELATPRVIENLTARPVANGVALTWRRPTEYVDGSELKDLAGFLIYRKDISPTCPDCPVPYRPLTTLDVEDQEKFVKQKQYRYVDEEVQDKMTYRYRVSSQLKDGSLSQPSNEVEITRGP